MCQDTVRGWSTRRGDGISVLLVFAWRFGPGNDQRKQAFVLVHILRVPSSRLGGNSVSQNIAFVGPKSRQGFTANVSTRIREDNLVPIALTEAHLKAFRLVLAMKPASVSSLAPSAVPGASDHRPLPVLQRGVYPTDAMFADAGWLQSPQPCLNCVVIRTRCWRMKEPPVPQEGTLTTKPARGTRCYRCSRRGARCEIFQGLDGVPVASLPHGDPRLAAAQATGSQYAPLLPPVAACARTEIATMSTLPSGELHRNAASTTHNSLRMGTTQSKAKCVPDGPLNPPPRNPFEGSERHIRGQGETSHVQAQNLRPQAGSYFSSEASSSGLEADSDEENRPPKETGNSITGAGHRSRLPWHHTSNPIPDSGRGISSSRNEDGSRGQTRKRKWEADTSDEEDIKYSSDAASASDEAESADSDAENRPPKKARTIDDFAVTRASPVQPSLVPPVAQAMPSQPLLIRRTLVPNAQVTLAHPAHPNHAPRRRSLGIRQAAAQQESCPPRNKQALQPLQVQPQPSGLLARQFEEQAAEIRRLRGESRPIGEGSHVRYEQLGRAWLGLAELAREGEKQDALSPEVVPERRPKTVLGTASRRFVGGSSSDPFIANTFGVQLAPQSDVETSNSGGQVGAGGRDTGGARNVSSGSSVTAAESPSALRKDQRVLSAKSADVAIQAKSRGGKPDEYLGKATDLEGLKQTFEEFLSSVNRRLDDEQRERLKLQHAHNELRRQLDASDRERSGGTFAHKDAAQLAEELGWLRQEHRDLRLEFDDLEMRYNSGRNRMKYMEEDYCDLERKFEDLKEEVEELRGESSY